MWCRLVAARLTRFGWSPRQTLLTARPCPATAFSQVALAYTSSVIADGKMLIVYLAGPASGKHSLVCHLQSVVNSDERQQKDCSPVYSMHTFIPHSACLHGQWTHPGLTHAFGTPLRLHTTERTRSRDSSFWDFIGENRDTLLPSLQLGSPHPMGSVR